MTRMSARQVTRALAAAVAGAMLLAVPAYVRAQAPEMYDAQEAFRQSDGNRDGAIDHGEYETRISEVFFFCDTDKDGRLTEQESALTLVETDHAGADSNGDGTLSMHEFSRQRHADFEQADTDDDGLLQLDEVQKTNP
jgi:hypothetical protein